MVYYHNIIVSYNAGVLKSNKTAMAIKYLKIWEMWAPFLLIFYENWKGIIVMLYIFGIISTRNARKWYFHCLYSMHTVKIYSVQLRNYIAALCCVYMVNNNFRHQIFIYEMLFLELSQRETLKNYIFSVSLF